MNAESAIADDLVELGKSNLTAVLLFASAARQEPAIVDGEYKSIEQFLVPAIGKDVDEHTICGIRHRY